MVKQKLAEFCADFEPFLTKTVACDEIAYNSHYKAMQYSLLAGGKRLRPYILNAFYKATGGSGNNAYCFASALEMIHTYSLIHDDLPSMDNDDFRRGRPACHKAFDEATALLAGDSLLTKAFEVAAKTEGIDSVLMVKGIALLAELAGADGMIGGQIIDLAIENGSPELEVVLNMYAKKTGALLVAAAKIGTIIAGGNEKLLSAAEEYALNLGIAFQIQDDILDIVGDSSLLGKPVGSDEKNNKSTYVSFKGLNQAKLDVEEYTNKAKKALAPFGDAANDLIDLADFLTHRQY